MQGRVFVHAAKLDATNVAQYGVEVSTEAMIMADGQSLEGVGVHPTVTVAVNPIRLGAGEDDQLSAAVQLLTGDAGVNQLAHEATT